MTPPKAMPLSIDTQQAVAAEDIPVKERQSTPDAPAEPGASAAEPLAPPAGAELSQEEAVRLACAWYDSDQGPFVGEYTIATPVLGAYFNSTSGGGAACEWSLRYHVAPSTGEEVSAPAVPL